MSRVLKQQIGFQNDFSDVAYFNFDNTGAYAPSFPSLTIGEITGIDEVETDENSVRAIVTDGMLQLQNVEAHSTVMIYTTDGNLKAAISDYIHDTGIALPGQGTYIILVVNGEKRQTTKVIY